MNRIKVELNWTYHPELNETFTIEDENNAAEIAREINARKRKIESNRKGVTTYLTKQRAEVWSDRLIVTCQ